MLSTQMQIQAIADRLVSLPVTTRAQDFAEPWRSIWLALELAEPGQLRLALVETAHRLPDENAVLDAILNTIPGAGPAHYPSLLEMAPNLPPIEWLWKGWIPRGLLTLLGSAPGAGKSILMLDLARRIIHGAPFPDGQPAPRPGANVLYVDAECVPQLINARATAWQMDAARLFLMLPEGSDMLDFNLLAHRDRLINMVARIQPELVIIDSLSSISSKSENNIEDVRLVMRFLNALVQDFHIALILAHHTRKGSAAHNRVMEMIIDDLRGSGHILAVARSILGLSVVQTGPKLDRNGPRRLEVIKTNLGSYPDALGFELVPLPPDDVRLLWGEVPAAYHAPTRLEEAVAWLSNPLRPAQVMALAQEEGFNRSLIYRAHQQLNGQISNTHGHQHPVNAWKWGSDPGEGWQKQ